MSVTGVVGIRRVPHAVRGFGPRHALYKMQLVPFHEEGVEPAMQLLKLQLVPFHEKGIEPAMQFRYDSMSIRGYRPFRG